MFRRTYKIAVFSAFLVSCSAGQQSDKGGAGGGGNATTNNGSGPGSESTPAKPEPVQPFNQNRSGQCSQNGKTSLALNLNDNAHESGSFGFTADPIKKTLPTVGIEVVRGSRNPTHCTGVLGSVVERARVDGSMPAGPGRDNSVDLVFPRIMTAGHCLRNKPGEPSTDITTITFTFKIGDDLKSISYNPVYDRNDPKYPRGILKLKDNPNSDKDNYWTLDIDAISTSAPKNDCTDYVLNSNLTPDQKVQTSCFSVASDRIDFKSIHEYNFKLEQRNRSLEQGSGFNLISAGLYANIGETLTQSLPTFNSQPNAAPDLSKALDWKEAFRLSFVRGNAGASLDDSYLLSNNIRSLEEYYKFLDRKLRGVEVMLLVKDNLSRGTNARSIPTNEKDPWTGKDNCSGWNCAIQVFGRTYDSPDGSGKVFQPNSFAFKSNTFGLQKGDSGGILKFRFVDVKSPLMTVTRTEEIAGVLSTVAGDQVCAGDDLLCCERSE